MNLYKNTFKLLMLCVMVLNSSLIYAQCNLLCNTDFDDNQVTTPGGQIIVDANQVPCWQTTASDNMIEIWNNGFLGVPSYSGNQFIELNAFMVSTIFQNFTAAPGTALSISFAHRGRGGVDVLGVEIGPVGGPYTSLGTYSDDNTAWGYYTVNYTIPMGFGNNYSIRFNSVSAAGGDPAIGNFLDAISINLPYTLTLITSHTNAGCNSNNGTGTVSVSGGTPPYSYSWNSTPVQTTQTATGLASASYTVTVTDSNGCVNTSAITLGMDPQPDVEVSAGVNPLCDSTKLNWASWASVNSTTGVGVISSDLSVTVTKPTGGLSTTGGMFNPGVFPTQYDVPVNNTAIRNDLAGLFTFCFNRPVVNPQIALSSIGNSGNSVQINTSVPYQVIWQGVGMSYPNNMAFIGSEGYTIIQFPGVHTCISFDYLQSETYCNLAFGTLDTNCQAVNPPPICAGQSDTLTATGASGYSWTPAAGLNTTTGAVVIATPAVTTTYYVTGSNGTNCTDTDSITITVNPAPAVSITGDTVLCSGDSTILTVSGGGSYFWKPDNSADSSITLSPLNTTTYTVVVTNPSGCGDSATVNVIISPLPIAQFSVPPVCRTEQSVFTNASTGNITSWNWDFDDNTLGSSIQNPVHTYSTCDSFAVTLVVTTVDGCVDTATNTARVYCLPLADFSFANACMEQSVAFTDLSAVSGGTITAWSWDFGDTTTLGTTQSPSHAYENYGIHTISLITTTNQGCRDTSTQDITIHPLPVITFTADNVCAGSIVNFENQSTIPAPYMLQSWVWDFADGTPVYNNPNILHPYPTPGVYTVELTVISDYGCADSLLDTVIVHPNPVVNFSATDTIGCAPLCLSFQDMASIAAPGTNSQWNWNLGDSSGTVTSLAFDHCYDNASPHAPAYYSVSLSVTSDSGCVTTLTKNNYITVLPNPLAQFTADPEISIVYPVVTIADQSLGADFWSWDFGDTDTSSLSNPPPHTYADTGSYVITLIAENQYGCWDTANRNVIVEPTFTFFIPNGFTPNGDGVNDSFGGQGTFIRNYTMSIFDRWGNFIFRTDAIEKPWDGTANHGKERAQQDTYVYVIEITDFKKQKYRYKGIVTLLAGGAD